MRTKKKLVETIPFAVIAFLYGLFGILLIMHHIASYDAILQPYMDYLIENSVITNDVSGMNFLAFFTMQSNILADLFLILYALGIFGVKRLYTLTHNEALRCAIALYIFITGLIYCAVLLPFATASFPMEKGIWFSNVVNIWNHMVTPIFFTLFWLLPVKDVILPKFRTALYSIIYPLIYFFVSIARGAHDGFYPYPFLNGRQVWSRILFNYEYNSVLGTLLVIGIFFLLCGIFVGVSYLLSGVHNAIVRRKL